VTARHPAGLPEGGQFRAAQAAEGEQRAAAVMAEAESRAAGRRDEMAAHPGTGEPFTGTCATDAADRWGAAGGGR
jgi:hypothetical protein